MNKYMELYETDNYIGITVNVPTIEKAKQIALAIMKGE